MSLTRPESAGASPQERLSLDIGTLEMFMPFYVHVDETGHIVSAGRSFQKLRPDFSLTGARLLEVLELKRPRNIRRYQDLVLHRRARIRAVLREPPRHTMNGLFVILPCGGALLNLSLGTSVVDAVRSFDLTSADFPPSDPTVDMLYLIEANTLAMRESRRLNLRLNDQKSEAEERALSDALTGLKNRRALDRAVADLANAAIPFGLMHLDLDFFKKVNDTLGHAAGDALLQNAADILTSETRAGDLVARIGGDEFVLVMTDCVDVSVLERIALRIIERLEEPVLYEGQEARISASIGTTLSIYYASPTVDQMLIDADVALYSSKKAGRGRHTVFGRNSGQR